MFLGRVVLPDEPLWLDEDREKVLAVLDDRSSRCSSCGLHDDDVGANGQPLRHPKYEPTTHRCFMCEAVQREFKAIPRGEGDGVTVRLRSVSPDEYADES